MVEKLELLIADNALSHTISANSFNSIQQQGLLWQANAIKIVNQFEKLMKE